MMDAGYNKLVLMGNVVRVDDLHDFRVECWRKWRDPLGMMREDSCIVPIHHKGEETLSIGDKVKFNRVQRAKLQEHYGNDEPDDDRVRAYIATKWEDWLDECFER